MGTSRGNSGVASPQMVPSISVKLASKLRCGGTLSGTLKSASARAVALVHPSRCRPTSSVTANSGIVARLKYASASRNGTGFRYPRDNNNPTVCCACVPSCPRVDWLKWTAIELLDHADVRKCRRFATLKFTFGLTWDFIPGFKISSRSRLKPVDAARKVLQSRTL